MTSIAIASPIAPLLLAGQLSLEPDDGEENLGDCPYLARWNALPGHDPEATCAYGCSDEPDCVTCQPSGGWPVPRHLVPVSEPPRCETCEGSGKGGRPRERIEGGARICDYCNRTLTFNFMRDTEIGYCTCNAAKAAIHCPDCTDGYTRGPVELVVEVPGFHCGCLCHGPTLGMVRHLGACCNSRPATIRPVASASLEAVLPIHHGDEWPTDEEYNTNPAGILVPESDLLRIYRQHGNDYTDVSHLLPLCDWSGQWAVLLTNVVAL